MHIQDLKMPLRVTYRISSGVFVFDNLSLAGFWMNGVVDTARKGIFVAKILLFDVNILIYVKVKGQE